MKEYGVLFVDDEINVLNSLKRIFAMENDIKVYTASNALEGIQILKKNEIYLLISDEKMPQVEGHRFLHYVKENFPEVVRILLTGYADSEIIIKSINKGEVFRYLKKPWDNNELLLTVRSALQHGEIKRKNKEMSETIKEQNKKLVLANFELDKMVNKRTDQLKKSLLTLKELGKEKNGSNDYFLEMLVTLFSLSNPELAAHTFRVVDTVTSLCLLLNKEGSLSEEIKNAAYFHDIGLLGGPLNLVEGNLNNLSAQDKALYLDHPVIAYHILRGLTVFAHLAPMILYHHQYRNGDGFPRFRFNQKVVPGTEVLLIADEYDLLITKYKGNLQLVDEFMNRNPEHYQKEALEALKEISKSHQVKKKFMKCTTGNLKEGMYLESDILTKNNALFFQKGKRLDQKDIEKLHTFSLILHMEQEIDVGY